MVLSLHTAAGVLDLMLLGNKYLKTEFSYPTDPGAGLRNRAEYARQFGPGGERLIAELGLGHTGGGGHNLQPGPAGLRQPGRLRRRRAAPGQHNWREVYSGL